MLVPIRQGLVPGERRTFEERLRFLIDNLAGRHEEGTRIELDRLSTIHFGRMIVIRPEQYLLGSGHQGEADTFDAFVEVAPDNVEAGAPPPKPGAADYRSLLLVLVEFDGDLKVYMREIAQFIGRDFDLIFDNCEDFPGTDDFDRFWAWFARFQIQTDLFYAPCPRLSVVQLRQLERFKRAFDAFVCQVRSPKSPNAHSIDQLFDAFLQENQHYAIDFPSPGGTYAGGPDDHGL